MKTKRKERKKKETRNERSGGGGGGNAAGQVGGWTGGKGREKTCGFRRDSRFCGRDFANRTLPSPKARRSCDDVALSARARARENARRLSARAIPAINYARSASFVAPQLDPGSIDHAIDPSVLTRLRRFAFRYLFIAGSRVCVQ